MTTDDGKRGDETNHLWTQKCEWKCGNAGMLFESDEKCSDPTNGYEDLSSAPKKNKKKQESNII